MKLQRAVSTNEKLYLSGARHFSDLVMHAVLEGYGSIDREALQDAVNKASDLLPGARLRLSGSRWIADAPAPQVLEMKDHPETRGNISKVAWDYPAFAPMQGKTLCVQVSESHGRSIIIFRALHAVMDGKGMQIWIKTVFQFLRGESPTWTDSLKSEDQVLDEMPTKKRLNEPTIPFAAGPKMKGENVDEAFRFSYARRSLRGTVPGIVAKLAKGVDQFLAKSEGDRSLMLIPVDVRSDMDSVSKLSTANLSFPLMLPVDGKQSWSELSQTFLDMLERKDHIARGSWDGVYRRIPTLPFSWLFQKIWLNSLRRGRYMASAVISHTGRQDLTEYSTRDFIADDMIFLPCVVPISPLGLVLSETELSTEISIVSVDALWDDALGLLDHILTASGLGELMVRDEDMQTTANESRSLSLSDTQLALHQLVERQARRSPDRTALIFGSQSMTYAKMNAKANRMAGWLLARGLKRSEFVGVGLERSFDMIIAILAILKAGGVYVPLDPSMPSSRLSYMVDDSRARFVLSRAEHAGKFGKVSEVLVLTEDEGPLQAYSAENLDLEFNPNDLCYMIYTSGSTGQPKGAMNKHSALANHFAWMANTFDLGPDDCTLQKTPISFDASLLEIFLPLQSGGRIVITKPEGHKDTRYMLDLVREHRVTFLSIVPSILNLFLDEIDTQEDSSLKLALVGGEEFTRKLYDKFKSRFPRAYAVNLYGPAEAAIDTLSFDCRKGFHGRSVPIGTPLANTEVYIVDDKLQAVEDGQSGELLIAGIQIGPGYWGRPELTDEKYITHPFHPDSPYKAYRTGDLARRLPGGEIEFLGRIDHQVKIRGVRIELGEIEHKMEQIPEVRRAVVIAKDHGGDKTLVAYWTGQDFEDFRKVLGETLPDYMLPSVYKKLDDLPLNANGKVDRSALPEVKVDARPEDAFIPKTARDKTIAEIWSVLLKAPVGIRTHFFEAGGNSLLAITLVVRVNAALKIKIHPQDLLENPRFDAFLNRVQAVAGESTP